MAEARQSRSLRAVEKIWKINVSVLVLIRKLQNAKLWENALTIVCRAFSGYPWRQFSVVRFQVLWNFTQRIRVQFPTCRRCMLPSFKWPKEQMSYQASRMRKQSILLKNIQDIWILNNIAMETSTVSVSSCTRKHIGFLDCDVLYIYIYIYIHTHTHTHIQGYSKWLSGF